MKQTLERLEIMHGLARAGGVLLLLTACTRDNAAYEEGTGPSTTMAAEADATKGASAEGPDPTTRGADGTSASTTGSSATETTAGADAPDSTTAGHEGTTGVFDGPNLTTGPPPEDCCTPSPACSDTDLAECVCKERQTCCAGWGLDCVHVAVNSCEAACELPDQDCCVPGKGPGCNSASIMLCVCDMQPACCFDVWSDTCVGLAAGCGC